ncbi:MAG TPA: hypothetical protein VKE70_03545 [Candidatus Solibacter sp.]|nr:hypothetical protein [Candidatus Solibacter sp.]
MAPAVLSAARWRTVSRRPIPSSTSTRTWRPSPFPAVFLPAGTGWLELHAGSGLTDATGFTVWWAAADDNPTYAALQDLAPTQPLTPVSPSGFQQYAFQFDGAPVTEPASVLLVLGAFCTFLRKRM